MTARHGPEVNQYSLPEPSARVELPMGTEPEMDSTPADKPPMKTVLYCRVSTADQTLEHQRIQAEAAGYRFDEVVVDHGISGVRTALRDRPEGKRLFDMPRAGDTLVVRWVDRLGRNYADVTDTIRQFIRRGVIVRTVINGLTFDGATKDPMQQAVRDSLIAFMAATAQSQAEVTKEAQKAGIAHALEQDDGTKYRRPSVPSNSTWSVTCSVRGSPSRLSPKRRGSSGNPFIESKPNPSGSLRH